MSVEYLRSTIQKKINILTYLIDQLEMKDLDPLLRATKQTWGPILTMGSARHSLSKDKEKSTANFNQAIIQKNIVGNLDGIFAQIQHKIQSLKNVSNEVNSQVRSYDLA